MRLPRQYFHISTLTGREVAARRPYVRNTYPSTAYAVLVALTRTRPLPVLPQISALILAASVLTSGLPEGVESINCRSASRKACFWYEHIASGTISR